MRSRGGRRRGPWWLLVGVLLGAGAVLIPFQHQHRIHVVSASMSPTLEAGSTVWMDTRVDGDVRVGDIVVFTDPGGWTGPGSAAELVTKRVIAVGGQALSCCGAGHRLVRDGRPLAEPYLVAGTRPSLLAFEVTVPAGYLWVMGDNRAHSLDSRQHALGGGSGFVPLSAVRGIVRN